MLMYDIWGSFYGSYNPCSYKRSVNLWIYAYISKVKSTFIWTYRYIWAGSLNRNAGAHTGVDACVDACVDAGVDAGAVSTDSTKKWIFKSFSRITPKKMKIN